MKKDTVEIKGFRIKVIGNPNDEDGQVAYLSLPETNGIKKTAKTIRLHDLLSYAGGPDIYLDFDDNDHIVGIEFI